MLNQFYDNETSLANGNKKSLDRCAMKNRWKLMKIPSCHSHHMAHWHFDDADVYSKQFRFANGTRHLFRKKTKKDVACVLVKALFISTEMCYLLRWCLCFSPCIFISNFDEDCWICQETRRCEALRNILDCIRVWRVMVTLGIGVIDESKLRWENGNR